VRYGECITVCNVLQFFDVDGNGAEQYLIPHITACTMLTPVALRVAEALAGGDNVQTHSEGAA
jgi:hypothetical protein